MNWNLHHSKAEELASQAELARRLGDTSRAAELYRLAAGEETLALTELDPAKVKTLGITTVSAASLWFKAGEHRRAEQVACQWLASDVLPSFAIDQLQAVLQAVWNERTFREAGIEFARGEILVRVAGGDVVYGGAPLDLIHLKVDEVRGLFYRTIELLLNRPLRRHGAPSADIQEQFRPWLLQAPAGSYQFAVRVQKPTQLSMFPQAGPEIEKVSEKVLQIAEATSQELPQMLETSVPDAGYRDVFLRLIRNLAPTGKTFKTLELKPTFETKARPVLLTPISRQNVNDTLRSRKKAVDTSSGLREEQVTGVLRALHLDRDWIEIVTPEPASEHIQIHQTGDVIDDIVGPLVNRRVVVDVAVQPDGKRLFRDVQSDE